MKKLLFAILALVVALFLTSCAKQYECEKPFIIVDGQCCTDKDKNIVCDKDEIPKDDSIADTKPRKEGADYNYAWIRDWIRDWFRRDPCEASGGKWIEEKCGSPPGCERECAAVCVPIIVCNCPAGKRVYSTGERCIPVEVPKLPQAPAEPLTTEPVILTLEQKQQICDSEVIFSIINVCVKDDNTLSITIKNDGIRDIQKAELKLYKNAAISASTILEGAPLVSAYSLKTADASSSPVKANEIAFIEAIPVIDAGGDKFICGLAKQSFGDNGYLTALPSC